MKGLKGAELADGLVIKGGEYKLVKTRFSAFFATHLDSVLKTAGIKNLVIVGEHQCASFDIAMAIISLA